MELTSKENATSQSIFTHLCNQMSKLSSRDISVEEAKAQSNLAKQANNLLRYELDRAIAIAKFGEKMKIDEIDR